ncbi:hypothetical protein Tco_0385952 [Tanacetum coccineum]
MDSKYTYKHLRLQYTIAVYFNQSFARWVVGSPVPIVQQLMASLHLESDSREDAPEWIHKLRPNTSQLKIPIYPEVHNPRDPWSVQEEMLLEDVIVANRSCVEKKKKMPSAPTVAPQGLAILLADAAVQTEASEDEASPRLLRSKSLPLMYNLDWP